MRDPETFQLWPAIDLMDGKPVRLTRGVFESKTEYNLAFEDILAAFHRFASGVHIIDLDGARDGHIRNAKTVEAILKNTSLSTQLGGGIRSFESARTWFDLGVRRIIVGSKALEDPDMPRRCADVYGTERIVISADVRDEQLMTNGWVKANNVNIFSFLANRITDGFTEFMVTDIRRDGTLKGASNALYKAICREFPRINLLAAGGIGSLADIRDIRKSGGRGAIFGKAFYEGCVSVEDLEAYAKC